MIETRPNNIIDLLDFYKIDYKMSGNIAMVNCLFHKGDNTPSMAVYKDTNSYYCFGCSSYGTVETLIMHLEHCTYKEAVKFLYGDGYEWHNLRREKQKNSTIDEKYLYNILSRNLKKAVHDALGNKEEILRLKKLIMDLSTKDVDPKSLYKLLKQIKGGSK